VEPDGLLRLLWSGVMWGCGGDGSVIVVPTPFGRVEGAYVGVSLTLRRRMLGDRLPRLSCVHLLGLDSALRRHGSFGWVVGGEVRYGCLGGGVGTTNSVIGSIPVMLQ